MSETEITVEEAVDATPAALAAAGTELHAQAAAQVSQHAERVDRELVILLEENRALRGEVSALSTQISELRSPPPAPDVVIIEAPEVIEETTADTIIDDPIVEVETGPPAPEPESEEQHETQKRSRKPFGRR